MKVPVTWLKKYVDFPEDTPALCRKLTMSGSKVEAVERLCADICGVVTGQVKEIYKHPNADKLLITKIDIGERILQIVTGAQNLKEGDYVPVALDGAVLAEGKKIKKGAIRGEVSDGMLCGIDELGYTRQDYPEAPENGIYVFPESQPLGADVIPILMLRDDVIEFEITSNRADCFSVIGIARETAATLNTKPVYPNTAPKEAAGGNAADYIKVSIENPDNCLRYCARVIKNVKIEPSPLWMRHCLSASGIRPINNIVDITNFVMLEYGQPLHAFNIENIADSQIIVRNAKDGEVFTTLDGQERVLDNKMTVIADPEKAVAIGGIMGGENSKVTEGSAAVLLESACFYGPNIRASSKRLGLRTDSSTKFEKRLDPNLCLTAINRAAVLIEELGCGEVVSGVVDNYPNKREPGTAPFDRGYINSRLGTDIPREEMIRLLGLLEIEVTDDTAHIPTFRPDITIKADLSEEVARLYGYDKIEAPLRSGSGSTGKKSREQIITGIVKDTLLYSGFCEMMSYSFESPKVFDKLNFGQTAPERAAVTITNPLGEDYSVMRTTPVNGMFSSLATNYNMRNDAALLFEIGKTYAPREGKLPKETNMLIIGAYGAGIDFFNIKGVLENIFGRLLITAEYNKRDDIPFLHPGRSAGVTIKGGDAGYLGEAHPTVSANYGINNTRVYIAVLDMDKIKKSANLNPVFAPLPKYPAVKRDIALIVKEDIPAAKIENTIAERGGNYLESIALFDVYTGDQIESGCKSVAYSLTFRAPDKTLTEEDVTKTVGKILKNLEVKINARLR